MGLALDEPTENEQTIPVNGVDVLIADEVKPFASGNVVDYIESSEGKGFIVRSESGQSCC